MSNPNPTNGFKPGQSAGRPKGSPNKVTNSALRKTLKKLRAIEDKALENIEKSVKGETISAEVLATSKWVVTSIVTVQKACVAEEQFKESLNDEDEDQTPVVEKPKFSLNIVK